MAPQKKSELEIPVSDEMSVPQLFEGQGKRNFLESLIVLAKHKFIIIYAVVGTALGSAIICLLLPKYYISETTIMPPQQGQSIASSMLDQLGGLGGIIGATAGRELGLKNPNDLYVAMLRSDTLADRLVDRFYLMDAYHAKLRIDARKRLEDLSEVSANKDGTISVSVEDRDPNKAAAMANAYIDELENLTKRLAVTDASRRRVFFDAEVKTATAQLEGAEQQLKKTQEATGIIQIDNQSRVMLQAYEDLRAQATSKEIEIESMKSFATPENPDLIRLQHELGALHAQIASMEKGHGGAPVGDIALEKVPEKALKYVDALREVTYRSSLLQLMLKQYEIARIDEARDSALIQVLDKAWPPERRAWPHRTLIVISFALMAFVLACLWCYALDAMERAKEDPQHLARLQLLKFYLFPRRKTGGLERRGEG